MTEFLEKQLERTNTWLTYAEAKNAALVAFNVALLTMFSGMVKEYTVFILSMILCIVSLVIDLISFKAHPNAQARKKETLQNLLFWAYLATFDNGKEEIYLEQVKAAFFPDKKEKIVISEADIIFAQEILTNSRISNLKYTLFNISLIIDGIAVILFALFILVA